MNRRPHRITFRMSDKENAQLMELVGLYRKNRGQHFNITDCILKCIKACWDTDFRAADQAMNPPPPLPAPSPLPDIFELAKKTNEEIAAKYRKKRGQSKPKAKPKVMPKPWHNSHGIPKEPKRKSKAKA